MRKWEYKKVALHEAARKRDDIDLLCGAGEQGWELVAILANNIAYLKREIDDPDMGGAVSGEEIAASTHEVKPKYRDPATGETWSGRGRMATWLKRKQDAGEDIDDYLV